MSRLESYQLTHPELLSEDELCEVLKKTCIGMLNFEDLSKAELVEIYKRVALPLPQRKHKNKNNKQSESDASTDRGIFLLDDSKQMKHCINHCKPDRLKSPISESNHSAKKICLSSSPSVENHKDSLIKRKCEEKIDDLNQCAGQKRQKITWP